MTKNFKDVCFFSIIFLIVDQAIKFYISTKMVIHQSLIVINNFLNITYVHNTGAAFSLFKDSRIFLIAIGILAVILLITYLIKLKRIEEFDVFIYSLLLGGILGNLIDRIIHGYVIDYINLNLFGYNFPIFNFADMCIVIGAILICIDTVKGDLWKK